MDKRTYSRLESATDCATLDDAINEWREGLEPRKQAVKALEEQCKDYYYQGDQRAIDARMVARKDIVLTEYYAIRKKNVGCTE